MRATALQRRATRFASAAVGLLAGLLALGPGLQRGYILRYDMVVPPNPPVSPRVFGAGEAFPREVPSDALLGVLNLVLPGQADLVQVVLLLAGFVLAAAGAGRLVPSPWLVPRLVAAVFYVWNPFVAERLLLGQWAFLLGYAGLPWVLVAAVALLRRISWWRGGAGLVTALVPAALGGFSSVVLSGLVAVTTVVVHPLRRAVPALLLVLAALVTVSLPWLLPALGSLAAAGVRTDPAAVELFAPRADTPFGVVASLFSLGGIWNAQAVPVAFAEPGLALGRLGLAVAALAGWVWLLWRGPRIDFGRGLSVAAGLGFAVALLGTFGGGRELLGTLIEVWSGFGVLRDGQLYVAPLALLQAVGLAGVALWLGGWFSAGSESQNSGPGRVGALAAAGLVVFPVVFLPGLAWGAWGRLVTVDYPQDWYEVQRLVNADPSAGAMVSLPWSAYRGLDWVESDGQDTVVPEESPRVVLDPARKLVERPVVADDALRVDVDSVTREAAGEDPWALEVGPLVADGWPLEPQGPDHNTAAELGDLGVRYVLLDRAAAQNYPGARELPDDAQGENAFWAGVPGVELAFAGSDLVLLQIGETHVRADHDQLSGLEVTGWLVMVGITLWSLSVSSSTLGFRVPLGPGAESRKESPACSRS